MHYFLRNYRMNAKFYHFSMRLYILGRITQAQLPSFTFKALNFRTLCNITKTVNFKMICFQKFGVPIFRLFKEYPYSDWFLVFRGFTDFFTISFFIVVRTQCIAGKRISYPVLSRWVTGCNDSHTRLDNWDQCTCLLLSPSNLSSML